MNVTLCLLFILFLSLLEAYYLVIYYLTSRYDPRKRITAAQALEHEYGFFLHSDFSPALCVWNLLFLFM